MRTKIFGLIGILLCLLLPATSMAQQGHPLAGIWLGEWSPTSTQNNQVVLEMSWLNTTLSGNINPGFPDSAVIEVGELDSSNWTVHLDALSSDESGNPVRVIIDGQLGNLGSTKRELSGTWRRGSVTGNFRVIRD
jgi:hypothetical protein